MERSEDRIPSNPLRSINQYRAVQRRPSRSGWSVTPARRFFTHWPCRSEAYSVTAGHGGDERLVVNPDEGGRAQGGLTLSRSGFTNYDPFIGIIIDNHLPLVYDGPVLSCDDGRLAKRNL